MGVCRAKAVKWGIGKKIVYAWVFALPVTAVISGILAFPASLHLLSADNSPLSLWERVRVRAERQDYCNYQYCQ